MKGPNMDQVGNLGGVIGLFKRLGSGGEKRAEPLSEQVIKRWLVERLAKQLSVKPEQIDSSVAFSSYGLDSLVAVKVSGDLEKLVERRLSPALLFEHPTIDALTQHLVGELGLGTSA
jgi:acyl carrier protein